MSKTDPMGFEYESDLLDAAVDNITDSDPYAAEDDGLILIALTREELEELGSFLASIITPATVPAVYQQVIDFAREATANAGRE